MSPTIVKTSANSTAVTKETDSTNDTYVTKEGLGNAIKEYLLNNPAVIANAIEELQKQKLDEQNQQHSEFLKDNITQITSHGGPPFLGNSNGDITVVLFYDYNCGYCKQAHTHIKKVLEKDKNVKFILRPLPILSDTSVFIAQAVLAMHKISPDHFIEMHDTLMNTKSITKDAIKKLVESYGIEYSALQNEMNSFYIKSTITQNYNLAKNIGAKGVPSQVINGTFIPGFLEEDKYYQIFQAYRKSSNNDQADSTDKSQEAKTEPETENTNE